MTRQNSPETLESAPHPAPFNRDVLDIFREMLPSRGMRILDPFAGIGRIHELRPHHQTWGIEIEPEWAATSPYTVCDDSTDLPFVLHRHPEIPKWFDVICTSPTYGNRLADHHEAKDGSKRNTYRHKLGRELHPNNSGRMQWPSPEYKRVHEIVYARVSKLQAQDFILNIKDHIRNGERQYVSDWHIETIRQQGWALVDTELVKTDGYRYGANSDLRVEYELVAQFRKRQTHTLSTWDGLPLRGEEGI